MTKRLLISITTVLLATMPLIFGCGDKDKTETKAETEAAQSLTILYPNWAEGIAVTNLAEVALEDRGYDVTIKPIEPGPIYASLAKGDCELFLDAWLPNTHHAYWEKYGDKIDKIGEAFTDGTTGLVVPAYVPENSIEDLKDPAVAAKYKDEIIGIGSGAGIHANTLKAIEQYGLPVKQITSSGPAMIASLKKAYDKQAPVVITGWKPHFMWARYDLKYLEDPLGVYPRDVMTILARKGFATDYPKLAVFFKNFNFTEDQLYSLMDAVDGQDDPAVGAAAWYKANKTLVDRWW